MTQRLCQNRECRAFYDKTLPNCPSCTTPKYAVNTALESERWRRSMNFQADHAAKYS